MERQTMRAMVRGAYDLQKLRIQTGLRVVANYKVTLGQAPSTRESELDAEGKEMLNLIRLSYKRMTDGLVRLPKAASFKADGVICDWTELALVHSYVSLEKQEAEMFKNIGHSLKAYPIFTEFLEGVKGVGPAMAGVIISEIDIHKARHPSSIWKYAGLDVAQDGRGRSRKAEHLVDVEYVNKDGKTDTRRSVTFNPWLKTKLYVLGTSFMRAGGKYSEVYRGYKLRLENHPNHVEKTKGHRHNMAIRYMVKIFLLDLYVAWRELEGLEVSQPYHEAKLGMKHGGEQTG